MISQSSVPREFNPSCVSIALAYNQNVDMVQNKSLVLSTGLTITMDYLRMDGKQYASKVRNKALEDFDWLSQWLE